MKALGNIYTEAEAVTSGDFKRLPAGGYVCEIKAVEDKTDKEYLSIIYDIAEGEFKAFYADEWGKEHPYAHRLVRSYKQTGDKDKDRKIAGMFKGFLRMIDADNGTKFEAQAAKGLNEQDLVGKRIGFVIGYEEYENDRGEVRERTNVTGVRSIEDIRSGNYKTPDVKKLTKTAQPPVGFEVISDADIPF